MYAYLRTPRQIVTFFRTLRKQDNGSLTSLIDALGDPEHGLLELLADRTSRTEGEVYDELTLIADTLAAAQMMAEEIEHAEVIPQLEAAVAQDSGMNPELRMKLTDYFTLTKECFNDRSSADYIRGIDMGPFFEKLAVAKWCAMQCYDSPYANIQDLFTSVLDQALADMVMPPLPVFKLVEPEAPEKALAENGAIFARALEKIGVNPATGKSNGVYGTPREYMIH